MSIYETTNNLFRAMNDQDFEFLTGLVTADVAYDFPGAGRVEGLRRTLLHFSGEQISFIRD